MKDKDHSANRTWDVGPRARRRSKIGLPGVRRGRGERKKERKTRPGKKEKASKKWSNGNKRRYNTGGGGLEGIEGDVERSI